MALYSHRFTGTYPSGAGWGFGWWAETDADLQQTQAAAEAWLDDFWTSSISDTYDSSFSIDGVRTALIDEGSGNQQNATETAVTEVGTGSGVSLMADASIVVTLRTDTTARVGRGRFYLPCGLVTQVTGDGRIDSTLISDLVSALNTAWANYDVIAMPVIYSRSDRNTRQITTYDIGDLWDTQRRRERGLAQTRAASDMPGA